jgi:hypothetical protein
MERASVRQRERDAARAPSEQEEQGPAAAAAAAAAMASEGAEWDGFVADSGVVAAADSVDAPATQARGVAKEGHGVQLPHD